MAYYRLIISLFIFSSWQGFAAYKPDEQCPFCSMIGQEACTCPPPSTASAGADDDTSSATGAARPPKRKATAISGEDDAAPAAKHKTAIPCSQAGCTSKSKYNGKCIRHGAPTCSQAGCTSKAYSSHNGKCTKHNSAPI